MIDCSAEDSEKVAAMKRIPVNSLKPRGLKLKTEPKIPTNHTTTVLKDEVVVGEEDSNSHMNTTTSSTSSIGKSNANFRSLFN